MACNIILIISLILFVLCYCSVFKVEISSCYNNTLLVDKKCWISLLEFIFGHSFWFEHVKSLNATISVTKTRLNHMLCKSLTYVCLSYHAILIIFSVCSKWRIKKITVDLLNLFISFFFVFTKIMSKFLSNVLLKWKRSYLLKLRKSI